MQVQQALAQIMAELPAIGKGGKASVAQGGYAYRGIEQITSHLQPLLAKHGVVIAPYATVISIQPAPGMKESWTDTVLQVTWKILGPDADYVEAQTVGIGRDNADKGANKAMSQAFKYLLLDLFCISDAKDDNDGADYSGGVREYPDTYLINPAPSAASVLFAKLITYTPETQAALRALAKEHGKKLSEKALNEDPEWLDAVVATIDQTEKPA